MKHLLFSQIFCWRLRKLSFSRYYLMVVKLLLVLISWCHSWYYWIAWKQKLYTLFCNGGKHTKLQT